MPPPLRFLTWLAPSLPLELFAAIADGCAEILERPVSLESVTELSGPSPDADPLACGEADVGFLCPPTFRRMRAGGAPVELLAAPVFADARAAGRPVYFSDVVVSASSPAHDLEDLRGGTFAYNDPASLSGWECLGPALAARGESLGFFSRYRRSGSHLASIELVVRGEADAAAIDSNALSLALARDPPRASAVRVLETWGPWPVQPVVVRGGVAPEERRALRDALLSLHERPRARRALAAFGVERFVPARECEYLDLDLGHGTAGTGARPLSHGTARRLA
jgi:ABC-type phosphate/phosphonate transport system substrate-binding protein